MGELQGTGNPGESGRGGEGDRGDQNHHHSRKNLKSKFTVQSLDISQANVRGTEHHHPIMDKLGDLGGRTYRHIFMH